MDEVNIRIIYLSDYAIVYFDGNLVSEGDSLNFDEVLKMLVGKTIMSYKATYVDTVKLSENLFIGQQYIEGHSLESLFE